MLLLHARHSAPFSAFEEGFEDGLAVHSLAVNDRT